MSRRSWVVSSLVSRPETFCWVLGGRRPDSLMLFVGHTAVSVVNLRTSASRSRQNSSMSRPGCCFVPFLGPGMRGARAGGAGDRVQAVAAGLVAGVDQLAEGFLRLAGPDRVRVGFRAVLQVTQQVLDAGLVAGDVLPCRVEVVAVPVGDRDPGEAGEYPEVLHGFQGPGAEVEQRVPFGERAVDVL